MSIVERILTEVDHWTDWARTARRGRIELGPVAIITLAERHRMSQESLDLGAEIALRCGVNPIRQMEADRATEARARLHVV